MIENGTEKFSFYFIKAIYLRIFIQHDSKRMKCCELGPNDSTWNLIKMF